MKITKLITSLLLFLSLVSIMLILRMPFDEMAQAQALNPYLEEIERQSQLPTFEYEPHEQAAVQPGASEITSAIYFALDFMKYLIGGIAVAMIIYSGVRLILARKKIDEVWPKQKEHLIMIVSGFIIIMIADFAVKNVFFGLEGEVFETEATAQQAAEAGTQELRGIYNIAMIIAGALAIFMLVVAGFRLLVSGGNEEVQTKVKKQITWLVIGLFVIGVAEFVVQDFLFPARGAQIPEAQQGRKLIVDFTNFASGFVVITSIISSIYGGYLYVTATGNEEKTGKAKKVLLGAVIGMILAVGAFAAVNTLIQLEPGT